MRRPARHLPARPRLGALFALLVVGAFAPGEVRAGCWSHSTADRPLSADGAFGLGLLLQGPAAPLNPLPVDGPRPCTGAFCSGNPATPPLSAPAVPPVFGQWALGSQTLAVPAPGSVALAAADARLVPVDHPCPVFHPPRSGA